jgi:tetratricopeptide (TPR) repeat protein/transglutaminase-like putative cysteine protease
MGFGIAPARAQDSSKQETPKQDTAKQNAPAVSSEKAPANSSADTNAQAYASEPVVYEKVRGVMRYEKDGTGYKDLEERIKVQSYEGIQKIGQQIFPYTAGNETVEVKSARVIKPDGKVITAGAENIVDVSAPVVQAAPMYTDVRQKHLSVPGLEVGDILEYHVVWNIVTPFTPGQFWSSWDFLTSAVTLDEDLTLDVPAGLAVMVKSPQGVEPVVTKEGERKKYAWKTKNDKAIEHAMPFRDPSIFHLTDIMSGVDFTPPKRVLFSTFQSWDDVGKWYAGLSEGRGADTPELKETAKAVTSGATTQEAKAEAIYDYVSHIRYVSLSFGLGRYQPHSAAEVMANRYGDCKDKATLMNALLEAEGIKSTSALIGASTTLDEEVATPEQFDHVVNVVILDGKEIWLDSTVGLAPFKYLVPELRGKNALVVALAGRSKLEPVARQKIGTKIYKFDFDSASGTPSRSRVWFEAQRSDWEVLLRLLSSRLGKVQMESMLDKAFKLPATGTGSATDLTWSDPFDLKKPIHFEAYLTPGSLGTVASEPVINKMTSLGVLDEGIDAVLPDLAAGRSEKDAIELGGPKEYFVHVRTLVSHPDAWKDFKPVVVKSDFAEYAVTAKLEDGLVTLDAHLLVRAEELPGTRAEEYKTFRKSVTARVDSYWKSSLTTVAQSGDSAEKPAANVASAEGNSTARGAFDAAKNAEKRGDYNDAVDLYRQAVTKAPELKEAWFGLGFSYDRLHEYESAENALHHAIVLDPEMRYAHGDLGVALAGQKRYREAIAEYWQELEIDAKTVWVHEDLGRADLMVGDNKGALAQFALLAQLEEKNPSVQFNLGVAYARDGQEANAVKAFHRTLELEPTADRKNSVAWELALTRFDLDEARTCVESAIASVESELRDLSIDSASTGDGRLPMSLAAYWDTLGWIAFQQGKVQEAEKYVEGAWQISKGTDIGDHLGQIYEAEKRQKEAAEMYALQLIKNKQLGETRGRLVALAGDNTKADEEIENARGKFRGIDSLRVKNVAGADGRADFWVTLTPAAKTGATAGGADRASIAGAPSLGIESKVSETKFIAGDEALRAEGSELGTVKFGTEFVDATDFKILRRVWVSCTKGEAECEVAQH